MDNLVLGIRGTLDQIVQRAMVIPRRRRPSYRSLTRGMCVRFAVESAFALPWKLRSVCSGNRVRFGVEYAYFYSRRFGPGIDVGNPARLNIRALENQIKTVDWLTALSGPLVQAVGGAASLALPPDWFVRQPLRDDGLIIQAGVAPESGVSAGPGLPPNPPAAYVVLNAALRPIVAQALDTLQSGTINSTAPLLNGAVASDHWLQRFNVPDDRLNDYWLELHKTPTVTESEVAVAATLRHLRKVMGLPGVAAPSNGMGYDGAPGA